MNDENKKRSYHNFNPVNGYPAGSNLFYECLRCGEIVPSRPSDSTHCKCRNIMIDVDYGRIKIQDHAQIKLFSTMD
jgi:hypothetical protein